MRLLSSLVLGVIIVSVCGSLWSLVAFGDIGDFWGFVLVSVICTGGMGLVFWIPLCLFVGWIASVVLRLDSKSKINLASQDLAVKDFVQASRVKGVPDSTISAQLQAVGWPQQVIDAALKK